MRNPSPITAVLVAILVALVGNMATNTVAINQPWWPPVIWTAVAILVLVTLRIEYARHRASAPQGGADNASAAKQVLAGLVAGQWKAEAILRSLDDPDPIPVQWHLTGDREVMDHPVNLTPASLRLKASSDDIAALVRKFRAMKRRRLVILGGPGAGKTTLAVQLVRELLDTRAAHPEEPVPVLLSVAGWDTVRFPHLHEWVAVRLATDYPALRAAEFGSKAPRQLATSGQVLPVLDGLDELPPPAQAAVITALNRFLGRDDQLILTSRTSEFTHAVGQAGDVLTSAVVIHPRPLNRAAAAAYLRRCLPPQPGPVWEQILTGLGAPAPPRGPLVALAELCTTPLGIWLVRTVYLNAHADPAGLLDAAAFPDAVALRAHLFDQLIDALIDTRPPSDDPAQLFRPRRHHDPVRVRRWLSYLAHQMSHPITDGNPRTRDLAWWHLARTSRTFTPRTRVTLAALTTIAVGLVIGLAAGLAVGLIIGLIIGLAVGRASRSWAQEEPGFANFRFQIRLPRLISILVVNPTAGLTVGLTSGLTTVLTVGLAVGLVAGLVSMFTVGFSAVGSAAMVAGLPFDVTLVLAVGGAVWLVSGVLSWTEAPTPGELANSPLASWRADRTANLLRILVAGLTIASVFGLMFGPTFGLMFRLTGGLVLGLTGGLTFGLARGTHRAWIAYLVTTYRLAVTGRLPRKLMPFLDDAHRLGLLGAVGPIYQFRHAELQDHLAAAYIPAHSHQR